MIDKNKIQGMGLGLSFFAALFLYFGLQTPTNPLVIIFGVFFGALGIGSIFKSDSIGPTVLEFMKLFAGEDGRQAGNDNRNRGNQGMNIYGPVNNYGTMTNTTESNSHSRAKNQNTDQKKRKTSVDIPDVRVECRVGLIQLGSNRSNSGEPKVDKIMSFEAKNFDERPVTISSMGIAVDDQNLFFRDFEYGDSLPKRLQYGETCKIIKNLEQLASDLKDKTPKYAWFEDALGHRYKSDDETLGRLLKIVW